MYTLKSLFDITARRRETLTPDGRMSSAWVKIACVGGIRFFVAVYRLETGTHLYQPATRFGSETAPGLAQFRV